MRLCVEWVGATRPPDEKKRVELTIRDDILEFFNGVENAEKAYLRHCASPRSVYNDWARAVHHGYRAVKGIVTPTEYARLGFKVAFEEREAAATQIAIGENLGNASGESCSGNVRVYNPLGTNANKLVKFDIVYTSSLPELIDINGTGRRNSNSAINALQFLPSSGNITSGTIRMYGIRKT